MIHACSTRKHNSDLLKIDEDIPPSCFSSITGLSDRLMMRSRLESHIAFTAECQLLSYIDRALESFEKGECARLAQEARFVPKIRSRSGEKDNLDISDVNGCYHPQTLNVRAGCESMAKTVREKQLASYGTASEPSALQLLNTALDIINSQRASCRSL